MRYSACFTLSFALAVAACSSDAGSNNPSDPTDGGMTADAPTNSGEDGGTRTDTGGDNSNATDASNSSTDMGGGEDADELPADMDSPDGGEQQSGWTDAADLPSAQQETAVVVLEGDVWVLGGFNDAGQEIATTSVYDPETNSWSTRASFPQPAHHMNAVIHDGQIWVAGFLANGFNADGRTFVYDPAEDAWTPGPDLPNNRERGSSAVGVIDGLIYVAGGVAGGAVDDFDVLDPETGDWSRLPNVPRAVDHAGFGVIEDKLIVAAGRDGQIPTFTDDVDIFDPQTGEWTSGAPIPTARGGVASAVWDGKLYVFGGEGDASNDEQVFPQAEVYDFAADSWEQLDDMPMPRHGLGAAAVDGVIYLPGGGDSIFLAATAAHDAYVP